MTSIKQYIQKNLPKLKNEKISQIPVLLHVPKCAGTYTLNVLIQLLAVYSYLKFNVGVPRKYWVVYQVYEKNSLFLRVLALDAKKQHRRAEEANNFQNIMFDDFLNLYRTGDISIFCLVVTSPAIFIENKNFLSQIAQIENKSFVFFTNLRTVFSRCLSLYYVHKKNNVKLSSLVLPSDKTSKEEFSSFLTSEDSSPSWILYFFSSVLNLSRADVFEFAKTNLSAAHITGVLLQLKNILEPIYGEALTNFLKFSTSEPINAGDKLKIYTPETLEIETLEEFKNLHNNDIKLVNLLLPDIKYDSSGLCEIDMVKNH